MDNRWRTLITALSGGNVEPRVASSVAEKRWHPSRFVRVDKTRSASEFGVDTKSGAFEFFWAKFFSYGKNRGQSGCDCAPSTRRRFKTGH
jgi:hypothetical protein